jgi:hypothetical protein
LFSTNHLLHPLAGSAFYGFSRVNGLGVGASFGYAALASIGWEFGLEYREQASINDLIFTPFGGMALGEHLFQLGAYLNSAPGRGSGFSRVASVTFGLPQRLHDWLDRRSAPGEPPADHLGLSTAYSHGFLLGYYHALVENSDRTERLQGFQLESEIVAMPGVLRPGRFTKPFADGNWTELRWRMAWGENGLDDVDLWVRSDLVGLYQQAIDTRHQGAGAMMALASALRFNQRDIAGHPDRFAIAHLPGPHAGLWLVRGALRAAADFSLHGDFAGVDPLAYDEWRGPAEVDGIKTILARHDYYYALGYSLHARARLAYGAAEVSGHASFGAYDSIEGIDRWQYRVTRDVPMHDSLFEYGASLGYRRPLATAVAVRLGFENLRRSGKMGDEHAMFDERRASAILGVSF